MKLARHYYYTKKKEGIIIAETFYKLTAEERETHLCFDTVENKWIADTSIQRDMNKFKKQGWKEISTQLYPDGTVLSMQFEAPYKSITIGKAERPKRVISDAQRLAAAERFKEYQKSKQINKEI